MSGADHEEPHVLNRHSKFVLRQWRVILFILYKNLPEDLLDPKHLCRGCYGTLPRRWRLPPQPGAFTHPSDG